MKVGIVNTRWALWLPDNIADWDAISGWEYERFASLHRELRYGDILFDVGAEHGWISAIIARDFVGPENIVLMEPSPEFWVNIRKTWLANGLRDPMGFWPGFVGEKDSEPLNVRAKKWPRSADPELAEIPGMAYRYLGDHNPDIQTITIDTFVERTSIFPQAINIDVEGAELMVLRGCMETFINDRPLVWVSIHPDLMERYGHKPEQIMVLMEDFGYEHTHLGTDHEQHFYFEPKERVR